MVSIATNISLTSSSSQQSKKRSLPLSSCNLQEKLSLSSSTSNSQLLETISILHIVAKISGSRRSAPRQVPPTSVVNQPLYLPCCNVYLISCQFLPSFGLYVSLTCPPSYFQVLHATQCRNYSVTLLPMYQQCHIY